MALLLSDSWTITRRDYLRGLFQAGFVSVSANGSVRSIPDNVAKNFSVSLSLAVHAIFFIALIFGEDRMGVGAPSGSDQRPLVIFDVPIPEAPAPFSLEIDEGQGDSKQEVAPVSDSEILQDPTILQWSVKRIKLPSVAGQDNSDVVQRRGETNRGGSGLGDGLGQAFDPYAGASPQYRGVQTGLREGRGHSDPRLDEEAVSDYIQGLRQRLGLVRGTVNLSVIVGGDGKIVSADVLGGNARVQLQLFIRADVVGRILYRPGLDGERHELFIEI